MLVGIIIQNKPSEEDVIKNSKPEYLYSLPFEQGRFSQVVNLDDLDIEVKVSTKTMLKAVYIKEKKDIEDVIILFQKIHLINISLSEKHFPQMINY